MSGNRPKLDLEINEINDNLAHIFQTLEKRPILSTEDTSSGIYPSEDIERLPIIGDATIIEEPVTNIEVPAFTTADVQIKYYDLENREYTNMLPSEKLLVELYDVSRVALVIESTAEIATWYCPGVFDL